MGLPYLYTMQVEYLIIGQGICGTMLSWFLQQAGKSFLVVDNHQPDAPSKVAAGIINPVTGRRFAYSWMIDTVMPFAVQTYQQIGRFLDKQLVVQKDIIDFFPTVQMLDAFATRLTENDTYLHSYPNQNYFNPYFNYDFGCGEIQPVYIADLPTLLNSWRIYLKENNQLLEADFSINNLQIQNTGIKYQDISAKNIIFCDGLSSMQHPWFKALPFAPSKGEVLIIESEQLPTEHIFKKGMTLAPLFKQNHFWVGSSYQWEYEHIYPTPTFYQQTTQLLNDWLKVPYKVVNHLAALRPSTLERRPFVGFHPHYPAIGILNGMGTKGTSLAPFFAHQLVQHITEKQPITPEAAISRFTRILSK